MFQALHTHPNSNCPRLFYHELVGVADPLFTCGGLASIYHGMEWAHVTGRNARFHARCVQAASGTASKSEITLKGSVEIVTEFFGYSINRSVVNLQRQLATTTEANLHAEFACSILYQRGIYPPETFTPVSKYGLSLLVTVDDGLKTYLAQVLSQLSGSQAPYHCQLVDTLSYGWPRADWLSAGSIQKLVVVIKGVESGDTLERWVFNIETDKAVSSSG